MSKHHFIIDYKGNKRNEYKYLEPFLDFKGIKNIIEPFCGSSAISFQIWLKNPHLNFYLSDINTNLINIYYLLKEYDINEIIDNLNVLKRKYNKPEHYKKFVKSLDENDIHPLHYIYLRKIAGRFRDFAGTMNYRHHNNKTDFKPPTETQLKFIDFIKSPNVHIIKADWFVLFNKYKNNKNSIIILDPPYINSDNSFYNSKDKNIYDDSVYRYFYKNKITSFKSNIFVILELIKENNDIFGEENIIKTYDKRYGLTYKKTKHVIYSNI